MNPKPIWYYFTTIPWQLLPWTIVMLPALPASIRIAWRQPRSLDRFMWIWFLAPLLVLSIVKAKHHQYLIHALTPCSYWAALGLLRWREVVARAASKIGWRIAAVVVGIAGIVAAVWEAPVQRTTN
jgi:4-amino-4-deoxy-L-arabinose transferase-like glycosyltransferase